MVTVRLFISRKNIIALLVGLIFALGYSVTLAAMDAYATIEGEFQGVIAGGVDDAGHVGKIRIKAFGSSVNGDFDVSTGVPSGGQQHRPIRILKNIDPASPKLLNAFADNETLTNVTFEFIRPSTAGAEELFYTIQLLNAHVVSILPSHSSQDDDLPVEMNETVSLTYQKMVVTWEDGNISGEADW